MSNQDDREPTSADEDEKHLDGKWLRMVSQKPPLRPQSAAKWCWIVVLIVGCILLLAKLILCIVRGQCNLGFGDGEL